jgi:hypothetical protein
VRAAKSRLPSARTLSDERLGTGLNRIYADLFRGIALTELGLPRFDGQIDYAAWASLWSEPFLLSSYSTGVRLPSEL